LEAEESCSLSSSVGKLFVEAADGISQIVCERNSSNEPNQELPPVLPHELARVDMRQFVKILQTHRVRLKPHFKDAGIELISQQFSKFIRAVREEPQFKDAVEKDVDNLNGFSESWSPTQGRFPLLQEFCGCLASAFPNAATVESDFSIIGWEKDDCRADLTDFSLERILHCKQFKALQALSHDIYNHEKSRSE
jgi:hypothetical protein